MLKFQVVYVCLCVAHGLPVRTVVHILYAFAFGAVLARLLRLPHVHITMLQHASCTNQVNNRGIAFIHSASCVAAQKQIWQISANIYLYICICICITLCACAIDFATLWSNVSDERARRPLKVQTVLSVGKQRSLSSYIFALQHKLGDCLGCCCYCCCCHLYGRRIATATGSATQTAKSGMHWQPLAAGIHTKAKKLFFICCCQSKASPWQDLQLLLQLQLPPLLSVLLRQHFDSVCIRQSYFLLSTKFFAFMATANPYRIKLLHWVHRQHKKYIFIISWKSFT